MKIFFYAGGLGVLLALVVPGIGVSQAASVRPAAEVSIVRRAVTIPMAEAGPGGLHGWLVVPQIPGKRPLVLLSPYVPHDSQRSIREMGPGAMQGEAMWFARRGWAVGIVMRRGMGGNGGELMDKAERCSKSLFERQEAHGTPDLRAAYDFFARQPEVDATRTIAVGLFEGGTMSIWLAKHPPPGLRAVINFRGGWENDPGWLGGSRCIKDAIVPAFAELGATVRLPMLWVYPKNDHWFGATAAKATLTAFNDAGGHAELETIAGSSENDEYPFREDPKEWGPLVEGFLSRLGLPANVVAPEAAHAAFKFPAGFPDDARKPYLKFLEMGDYKAFAMSPSGRWGYTSGRVSLDVAKKDALSECSDEGCKVVAASRP